MKRIAIMGLGLMGGSLGLALKARAFDGIVAGYARREDTCAEALRRGIVDEAGTDPVDVVRDADLIIFCTPILTIPDLVAASLPGLKPGALLTDVGSTKADLSRAVEPMLCDTGAVFIGSHPIAGSEQQGLDAARADLYERALVVVTPPITGGTRPESVRQVADFWKGLDSMVTVISSVEHDQWMARTSHLPHMIASLLAATAARDGDLSKVGLFCGTGFRDTSRIADGSPDVWHDIVRTNAPALLGELVAFQGALGEMVKALERGDFDFVRQCLETGQDGRRRLMAHSPAKEGNDDHI